GARGPVAERRRDEEAADTAELHPGDALVPPLDDLAVAECEGKGRAALLARAVEAGAVLEPAGVLHGDVLAGGGLGPGADRDVPVLQPVLGGRAEGHRLVEVVGARLDARAVAGGARAGRRPRRRRAGVRGGRVLGGPAAVVHPAPAQQEQGRGAAEGEQAKSDGVHKRGMVARVTPRARTSAGTAAPYNGAVQAAVRPRPQPARPRPTNQEPSWPTPSRSPRESPPRRTSSPSCAARSAAT